MGAGNTGVLRLGRGSETGGTDGAGLPSEIDVQAHNEEISLAHDM